MNRRILLPLLALVLLAIVLSTLLADDPVWAVPALVLVGIIGLMALGELLLKQRTEARAGDPMSDSSDPVPTTHLATDEETPLGDTSQAHDELSPHDLPKDHPGRAEAERQAGDRFERTDSGVTRGG